MRERGARSYALQRRPGREVLLWKSVVHGAWGAGEAEARAAGAPGEPKEEGQEAMWRARVNVCVCVGEHGGREGGGAGAWGGQ